jgi:hypothetical protein
MKKQYILFIIGFFLFANTCNAKSEPSWINQPYTQCKNNQICTSGSGRNLNAAKTDARNNILKYFETDIKSDFVSSLSTDEKDIKNFSSENTQELSEGILKGVEIKETFQNKNGSFALAVLNKDVAGQEITNDINELDSKMKLLLAEKDTKYNKQLGEYYQKRQELNKKYLILTGSMIPEVIKYKDIFGNKKLATNLTYYIKSEDNDSQNIINYLKDSIINSNSKITNNSKEANRIIVLNINKTNLYLNVDGFIKQKYTLTIKVFDNMERQIRVLTQNFVETGRNDSQIQDSIDIQIKKYFDDNISSL